ncbi:MAG: 50S ribosomal protein L29 [Phycisphaerales bacterium]|nr:50S ribosomal protein L29 [Phycisphaerales bacterium]
MNGKEVRALRSEQLALEVQTKREKLFQLRQQATTEKVADISQFKKIRRDVARLLTEHAARNPKPRKGTKRQAAQ